MDFQEEVRQQIAGNGKNEVLLAGARSFMLESIRARYSYNFEWLGRPIIQYPQDVVAMQGLIWSVRPDLVIETGIAHGGSLILSASMLAVLDYCDAVAQGDCLDPARPKRRVLGVDIDIRSHNRRAVETHPLSGRIDMLQGSSVSPEVAAKAREIASSYSRVLVCLDSNHTEDHVFAELDIYAPLVSPGSYCVVFDTVIERLPREVYPDREWAPGNNPATALQRWLKDHPEFSVDAAMDDKLLISVAPGGYLKRAD